MRWLRTLSAPLSPLYAAVVRGRNRAFDRYPARSTRVEAPVVSLGNLTMGGTGKTPLTLYLAEGLQRAGWSNAVLSRGYGGRRRLDPMEVQPDADPAETGDEAAMMAARLGDQRMVVARKRIEGARLALAWERPPRCLLLDDGFQHRSLHRDLDLLVLDGVKCWGNGRMLPAGDLREPMESARRAHALVVTRSARGPRAEIGALWALHGSGGPIFFTDFVLRALHPLGGGEPIALPWPEGPPVLAFCALGHPKAFFADLLLAGVHWLDTASFRDHHRISGAELRDLAARAAAAGAKALVCTEKDAIKVRRLGNSLPDLPILVTEQAVQSGEPLLRWVLERLEAIRAQAQASPAE